MIVADYHETPTKRRLFTVEEFVKLPEFSYMTASGMRHLIFKSRVRKSAAGDVIKGNGLAEAGVIIRLGRRVLIDADMFREWALSHREIAA